MTTEDTKTDANTDTGNKSDTGSQSAIDTIQQQLADLARKPGLDDTVKADIAAALADAKKISDEAIAARTAAKTEADSAVAQVAQLRTELRNANLIASARDAGAKNPETVAKLIPADVDGDKLDAAITALKESDGYLFGSEQQSAGTGGFDMSTGSTSTGGQGDKGLASFAEHLGDVVGVTRK